MTFKKKKKDNRGNPALYKGMKSLNPNGRPVDPDFKALKECRELSKAFVETKIAMALQRTIPQLKEISESDDEMAIDVCLSRIILRACIEGEHRALDFLFNRIIGKVVDKEETRLPKPFVIESLEGKKISCGMSIPHDEEE